MDKTVKVLLNALKADPENWETRRHIIDLLREQGDEDGAYAILREAPCPPTEQDDLLLAAEMSLPRDAEQAATYADLALARDGYCGAAHLLKSRAMRSLDRKPQAFGHYSQAIALDPSLADAELAAWAQPPVAIPPPVEEAEEHEISPAKPLGTTGQPPRFQFMSANASATGRSLRVQTPKLAEPKKMAVSSPKTKPTLSTPAVAEASAAPRLVATPATEVKVPVALPPPAPVVEKEVAPGHELNLAQEAAMRHRAASSAMMTRKGRQSTAATAVFGAGLLHAGLVLLFLLWVVTGSKPNPPELIAMAAPAAEIDKPIEQKVLAQQMPHQPSSSSAARAPVLVGRNTTATVALPEITEDIITDDIIGAGDTFGNGAGWGDGDGVGGGGTVQFFGDKQQARRVAYVVDFSYSMGSVDEKGTFIDALKKELERSITNLAPSLRYAVIFFSGNAWTQEERPDSRDYFARLNDPMPKLDLLWMEGSAKNKQATIERVKAMPLAAITSDQGGGTFWTPGLNAALAMQPPPDLIYLLTDGVAVDGQQLIEAMRKAGTKAQAASAPKDPKAPATTPEPKDAAPKEEETDGEFSLLDTLFKRRIPIHTIAFQLKLEAPRGSDKDMKEAYEKAKKEWFEALNKLLLISRMTVADFSVVLNGTTYTGERAAKFAEEKPKPN